MDQTATNLFVSFAKREEKADWEEGGGEERDTRKKKRPLSGKWEGAKEREENRGKRRQKSGKEKAGRRRPMNWYS